MLCCVVLYCVLISGDKQSASSPALPSSSSLILFNSPDPPVDRANCRCVFGEGVEVSRKVERVRSQRRVVQEERNSPEGLFFVRALLMNLKLSAALSHRTRQDMLLRVWLSWQICVAREQPFTRLHVVFGIFFIAYWNCDHSHRPGSWSQPWFSASMQP